uniref:NAD(+) diphosphatase n=1 Tax=Nephromyces sp. MMRI TaxID=2496275 RepID=A0A3Q8UCA9_9APIC|nr:nudix hydrolase 12 [Nephromyces sp. MMRI]
MTFNLNNQNWHPTYFSCLSLDVNGGQILPDKKFSTEFLSSDKCLYTLTYKGMNIFSVKSPEINSYPNGASTINNKISSSNSLSSDSLINSNDYSSLKNDAPALSSAFFSLKELESIFFLSPLLLVNLCNKNECTSYLNKNDPILILIGSLPIENFHNTQNSSDSILFFSIDITSFSPLDEQIKYVFKSMLPYNYNNLTIEESSLYARASGLAHFHRVNIYCSKCGNKMKGMQFGSYRICVNCAYWIYPRIDPAVIMLIYKDEYIILANKKKMKNRKPFYSILAGFSTVGENIEQTIQRETFEEVGVDVDLSSIKFYGSQCWPFPQSIMIGFIASTLSKNTLNIKDIFLEENEFNENENCLKLSEIPHIPSTHLGGSYVFNSSNELIFLPKITLHDGELADARWFHFSHVNELLNLENSQFDHTIVNIKVTIAYEMIEYWIKNLMTKMNFIITTSHLYLSINS